MVANALDRFARDDPDQVSRWVQFGRSPLAIGPGESSSDGHRRESDAELPSLGVATDSGLSPTLPCDGPRLSRYSDRPSSANELARHSLTKVRLRLVVLTSVVQVVRLAREEQQAALLVFFSLDSSLCSFSCCVASSVRTRTRRGAMSRVEW